MSDDTLNEEIVAEYTNSTKTDGMIIITGNEIIKIKDESHLTVDLRYDEEDHVFVDANMNVYVMDDNVSSYEIQRLIDNEEEEDILLPQPTPQSPPRPISPPHPPISPPPSREFFIIEDPQPQSPPRPISPPHRPISPPPTREFFIIEDGSGSFKIVTSSSA